MPWIIKLIDISSLIQYLELQFRNVLIFHVKKGIWWKSTGQWCASEIVLLKWITFFDWVTSEGIHINMVYNMWKGKLTRTLWKIKAVLLHYIINTWKSHSFIKRWVRGTVLFLSPSLSEAIDLNENHRYAKVFSVKGKVVVEFGLCCNRNRGAH